MWFVEYPNMSSYENMKLLGFSVYYFILGIYDISQICYDFHLIFNIEYDIHSRHIFLLCRFYLSMLCFFAATAPLCGEQNVNIGGI